MAANRPGPRDIEQQVQEDLSRLEAYRSQLGQMLQQHQVLQASHADHLRAREALEGLERAEADADVLLPIGGEAYVRGHPDRKGPVLLGIGSGLVAEIERPRAVEMLAQRAKQIEDAASGLEQQLRTLEERMNQISRRVEALTSRGAPGDGAPGDVGGD
jgi:prefoldin alpha subunit